VKANPRRYLIWLLFCAKWKRVLLVDSDLRRPSLHRFKSFQLNRLDELFAWANTLEEVIQTTPMEGFDFLPSGKLPRVQWEF
jgi:Mrp family chromosome partitioning ATPase